MQQYIKIEVKDAGEDKSETRIELAGDVATILTYVTAAMLDLNKRFDIITGQKNFFWNGIVYAVGQELLEESKR
jgi:hypothetical protein